MDIVHKNLNSILLPINTQQFNHTDHFLFNTKQDALNYIIKFNDHFFIDGVLLPYLPNLTIKQSFKLRHFYAAINYYLFDIKSVDLSSINFLKIQYSYLQNYIYLDLPEVLIEPLSLFKLSRNIIRTCIADHLNLIRIKRKYISIFKPLIIYNKNFVSWNPNINCFIKKLNKYLPTNIINEIVLPKLYLNNFKTKIFSENNNFINKWQNVKLV